MTLNPVLQDLYLAVGIWSNAWSKNQFDEKKDDTPLGKVLDWGLIPYTSPFGINWLEPDAARTGTVFQVHFDTQQIMLQALSDAVIEDTLLNPDNMVILVDLNSEYNEGGDFATLIFPNKDGNLFYGSRFDGLKKFDESSKTIGDSRDFYRTLKEARLTHPYNSKNYAEVYSEWTGWLDSSGDFYGNYSDMIRDSLKFEFDTENPDEMLNLGDEDKSDFSKVWIVVPKSIMLPMMLNWNEASAKELWNLLSR